MPRGGRRPGAGAPKHNFNALKNGKYSDRMRRLGAFLLRHPLLRLIYKRIRANLAKQALTPRPAEPAPRGFLAIFVNGKLRRFYLAPKNKKKQSNIVIFSYTEKAAPEKTIIQSPNPDTLPPSRAGKGPGLGSPTPFRQRLRRELSRTRAQGDFPRNPTNSINPTNPTLLALDGPRRKG